ncbi:MAG: HEAT repeat domain-containing protein [Lentisphaeria bacterium]|nr:HEAT repeat domain-containing protein [Lentisphaeria bacterium]
MGKLVLMFAAGMIAVALPGCGTVQSEAESASTDSADEEYPRYEDFICSLDVQRFKQGYPALIKKLDSDDRKERVTALQTIAASGEADAIPVLVPLILNDPDSTIAIWAGSALEKIVASHALRCRDFNRPETVVILPLKDGDLDLRPLAWVIRKMLEKPDDGNTHSYAATMIGYLGLKEFDSDLRKLLQSRHPAVTGSAEYALRLLNDSQ